jgi:hypothetical protein
MAAAASTAKDIELLAAKGIEVEDSALALQLVNALGGQDVESAWQMLCVLAGRYGLTL